MGVDGPEVGVSGPYPLLILPPRRKLLRSGVIFCAAFCNRWLIAPTCDDAGRSERLVPLLALSEAEAGPVGTPNPFDPEFAGLDWTPLGPDGGSFVTNGGMCGRSRLLFMLFILFILFMGGGIEGE